MTSLIGIGILAVMHAVCLVSARRNAAADGEPKVEIARK
jgi:hypothetical protein